MLWFKRSLVHALALSLAASGCASHAPTEWVVHPADPLPRMPYVIADATPVNLSGFHLSEGDYKSYLAVRDARIKREMSSAGGSGGGGFGGGGGHPLLLIVALPIALIVMLGVSAAVQGNAYANASDRDRMLDREESARLSRLLARTTTGAELAGRTGGALGLKLGETAGWLQVSVKSIEQRLYPDGRVALAIHAQAQAVAPDGTLSPPSEHFVLVPPKDAYSGFAWRDDAVERDLNQALDMLASSIASTYRPDRIAPPSQRYTLQGDARVTRYTPGLREFIRDYEAY